MTKKAAEKLWLTANKVRGTFEISDLCEVVIFTLFIKYVEIQKKSEDNEILLSYDDKFSVGYLALTYGKMVNAPEVTGYMKSIEQELGLEGNVISGELGKLLGMANVEIIRVIFGAVEQISFENSEQLYEVALQLLSKLSYARGRMSGEQYSNLSLCKLEAKLLDCQGGMTVYDGFCGCGVSANEAANNKGIVFMQDINVSTIALASVLTLLKGNEIGAIRCGDSQLNPLSYEEYDRIVSEPPFMPKYSNDYFMSMPSENFIYQDNLDSESLALRHSLAHLKKEGIAIVLVPMGFLFKSGKGAEIREKLIVDNYIDTVIELPSGVLPSTGAATALLIFRKNKSDNAIYMINAKSLFEKVDRNQVVISDENIDKIVNLYNTRESVEGISHNTPIEEILNNGYNLCTTQYVILSPKDSITVEDTAEYAQKYEQLISQLMEMDGKLGAMRGRFIKGNIY